MESLTAPEKNARFRGRSLEMMILISRHGYVSKKRLKETFGKKVYQENLRRNIRHLIKAGLIEYFTGDDDHRLGYRLTKQGLLFCNKSDLIPKKTIRARPFFKSTYDHDERVIDFSLILSKSPLVSNFRLEYELRAECGREHFRQNVYRDKFKVPDGLFTLKTPNGIFEVAFEYERTQKSEKRYEHFFKNLSISRKFQLVFIVVKEATLLSRLERLLKKVRAKDPDVMHSNQRNGIYFTDEKTLLEEGLDAPWSGDGKSLTLKEVEQRVNEKPA